jgi:hypothetical protein
MILPVVVDTAWLDVLCQTYDSSGKVKVLLCNKKSHSGLCTRNGFNRSEISGLIVQQKKCLPIVNLHNIHCPGVIQNIVDDMFARIMMQQFLIFVCVIDSQTVEIPDDLIVNCTRLFHRRFIGLFLIQLLNGKQLAIILFNDGKNLCLSFYPHTFNYSYFCSNKRNPYQTKNPVTHNKNS